MGGQDGVARFQSGVGIPPPLMRSMERFGKTTQEQITDRRNTFIGYQSKGEIVAAAVFAAAVEGDVAVPLGMAFTPGVDRLSVLPILLGRGFAEERPFTPSLTHVAFQVGTRAEWEAIAPIMSAAVFPGPDPADAASRRLYLPLLKQFGLVDQSVSAPSLPAEALTGHLRPTALDAWWAEYLPEGRKLTCLGRCRIA